MNKYLSVVTMLVVIFVSSISVKASDFDPVYYAQRYPDVVAVLGDSTEALLNHYNTYGIKEGRFKNAEEEKTGTASTDISYINKEPINGYSTYVDVDIINQTVTYFENGIATIQAPCVTGLSGKRDTPKGTWKVTEHTAGRYLTGPTWKCWVDYWMCFTPSRCGLHDASWRSAEEFNNQTYLTNGSHGCVNLQKDFAKQLFDKVSVGTTVIVH